MFNFDKKQLEKISTLEENGVSPYPKGKGMFEIAKISSLRAQMEDNLLKISVKNYAKNRDEGPFFAGRLLFKNEMGKLGFARVADESGAIQISITKKEVSAEVFSVWKKLDVGDWIIFRGNLDRTRTGELTLKVSDLSLYSKCMAGMPDKIAGINAAETLQRQRYLDLMINQNSRKRFAARSKIVSLLRKRLEEYDFMEVETPILQSIPGGASAQPFETHHNALSQDLFLRIAPELYLKRLLVGGFERVFEIGRNFRNEGISRKHNPEFTMVEFYAAHATYTDLIAIISMLLKDLSEAVELHFPNVGIDFSDVEVIRFEELLKKHVEDPWSIESYEDALRDKGYPIPARDMNIGEWFTYIFDNFIESELINPTFVTHFPVEISPLARKNDDDPRVTDRFELFIGGQEIANGFTELNDPVDQAERFVEQVKKKAGGDLEAMYFDEDYIRALSYGMPPAAGAGIGIDRLVMLLTNSDSIRDVILFPTLRRRE